MSKHHGFSTVILIIILALLAGGGYWVWQNKAEAPAPVDTNIEPPAPPIPSTPSVDTASWKTYKNEKYGFEFKYPGNWNLKYNEQTESIYLSSNIINFPTVWGGQLTPIEVYILPPSQFTKTIKATDYENYFSETVFSDDEEKIGKRLEGVYIGSEDEYSYGLFISQAYLNRDDYKTSGGVVFSYRSSGKIADENYLVSNQILSTFRFTR